MERMKRYSNALRGLLLASVAGIAAVSVTLMMGASDESTTALDAQSAGALRYMKNEAFGFSEKLTFSVGYKFVTAGYAVMQISDKPVTVSDRSCYEVKFDVRTTSSFDKIFKVRDQYRTYIDIDGIFPWRFQQTVREGNYKRDFSAIIDQKNHKAKTTEGTFDIPAFVHDVLSAFYYTRAYDIGRMKKGQSFTVQNFYGKKAYDLKVVVLGKQQVEVEAGTFNCVVVEPLVAEGGLFKSEGRIILYLTDDDRKIPVKVSAKVLIGSIDSELIKYSGTRGPIAAKVK